MTSTHNAGVPKPPQGVPTVELTCGTVQVLDGTEHPSSLVATLGGTFVCAPSNRAAVRTLLRKSCECDPSRNMLPWKAFTTLRGTKEEGYCFAYVDVDEAKADPVPLAAYRERQMQSARAMVAGL
jgi:hypothetical protein